MLKKKKNPFGYRILSEIGTGAASKLYSVVDPKTKQIWALKHVIKNDEKDQRFLDQVVQEYNVGSKFDHPNIRRVERLIRHRKLFRVTDIALVMELVDALTIDQRLPKSQEQAVRIFLQVARGLAHMHEHGYVHADIKPTNILVSEDDTVKIIDLGQACPINTIKKRIQGTPGYMAPEQAHRQAIVPQTDIYNLGATMYWTLLHEVIPTALPPKDGQNSLVSGALDPAQVQPPVPPHKKDESIHPLLSQQILDCVEVSPSKRPETMQIVADRLELFLGVLEQKQSDSPSAVNDDEETTIY